MLLGVVLLLLVGAIIYIIVLHSKIRALENELRIYASINPLDINRDGKVTAADKSKFMSESNKVLMKKKTDT